MAKGKITGKRIMGIILIILLILQFFQIDKSNPAVDPKQDFVTSQNLDPAMAQLVKDACYDCHSNEVHYPWYTYIQPIGRWIKGHINHGQEELNFSTWQSYADGKKDHKLEECAEWVADSRMPLKSYTWLHPEAKMTTEQQAKLASWFESLRK